MVILPYQFSSHSFPCILSEGDEVRQFTSQAGKRNIDMNPEFWGNLIWLVGLFREAKQPTFFPRCFSGQVQVLLGGILLAMLVAAI